MNLQHGTMVDKGELFLEIETMNAEYLRKKYKKEIALIEQELQRQESIKIKKSIELTRLLNDLTAGF